MMMMMMMTLWLIQHFQESRLCLICTNHILCDGAYSAILYLCSPQLTMVGSMRGISKQPLLLLLL